MTISDKQYSELKKLLTAVIEFEVYKKLSKKREKIWLILFCTALTNAIILFTFPEIKILQISSLLLWALTLGWQFWGLYDEIKFFGFKWKENWLH